MTYAESLAYLASLAQFGWKLDLARIRRLCHLAGRPERAFPAALVGGSAGKGSTCALLAAILRAAGLRTGTSPKPHLRTHRERVQVNGRLIPEAAFARLMTRIRPLAQQVAVEEGSPTVFEVMTLLALLHFAARRVDRAVVEVGLGGRFDATNVLEPDLAVITTIHLDHTDRLGTTLPEIAFEKAGILRANGRLVTGAAGEALAVIERAAAERGSAIWRLGREVHVASVRTAPAGTTFDVSLPGLDLPQLWTPLTGAFQAENAGLAAAAAWWLRDRHPAVNEAAIRRGLATARIPARLECVRRRPLVLVDAAHSPDRAAALAAAVRTLYLPPAVGAPPDRRLFLVLGCSTGHAPAAVVAALAPLAARVFATRSAHPAAVPAAEVAAAAAAMGVPAEAAEPVGAAVAGALAAAGPRDAVLITGSLFVAGEALAALEALRPGRGDRIPPAPPAPQETPG